MQLLRNSPASGTQTGSLRQLDRARLRALGAREAITIFDHFCAAHSRKSKMTSGNQIEAGHNILGHPVCWGASKKCLAFHYYDLATLDQFGKYQKSYTLMLPQTSQKNF